MLNPEKLKFNNHRSVRFNLDNFALPVVVNKKKNTIYTNYLAGLKGTKRQLLPLAAPRETYGYDLLVAWGSYLFAANSTGLYYADQYLLSFAPLDQTLVPQKMCAVNDRLFLLTSNRRRVFYSVEMTTNWTVNEFISGSVNIPDVYGACLDLVYDQGKLLLICENGLLTLNRHLVLAHLSSDSEVLKNNLVVSDVKMWASDWFSLGYATDTQTLREVFLKTDTALTLVVTSNRRQRAISVPAGSGIQKIKTNLNGDQFQITLLMGATAGKVSDLSAVVAFGKRG